MHIGIAGNIGSGKTTLTRMLAEHYGWTPKYESVTYNPYLEDYYKDIPRWSYNLETYFLAQRFKDLLEISRSKDVIIQDRTLFEVVHIFVANNYAMGNLSKRDYETYMDLFGVMAQMAKYVAVYSACGLPAQEALDQILARKVLRKLGAANPALVRARAGELLSLMSSLFGEGAMPLCEKAVTRISANG